LKLLLIAKQKGIIESIKPIITQLNENGFRVSPKIIGQILKLANEEY
jgi:predicted nucleic acid-binding protein